MPKQIIDDEIWGSRIPAADRYYKSWERRFKCSILEDYYEGRQWKQQENLGYEPYVINEVYDILQIKIAQFMPTFPKYEISPKAGNIDDFDAAANSAQLKQDTLNTLIQNDDIEFVSEVELAYRDSYFRFGIVEIGYASEWILNPNAPKPLLRSQADSQPTNPQKIKKEPQELPVNERIYVKHIPARTFRVGGYDHKYLNRCGWVGYYEFVDKDDLLALPGLMNKDKIPEQGIYSNVEEPDIEKGALETRTSYKNTFKIWRLWDLRARVFLLILDDGPEGKLTIFQRGFRRLPLFDLRPDKRLIGDGFYPIPPVFHWISPQNELNETREQLRAHRRRFTRKFQVLEDYIDDVEIEKFESGQDGSLIKVKSADAIAPIQNAELGQALDKSLLTSRDDMNRLSGTSNQVQGVVDRSTATEAQLINARSQVRENKDRDRVIKWLSRIGREVLLTARDKFVLGTWIELSQPEGEMTFGEIQDKQPTFAYVTHQDLNDGYDYKIDVDVTSISVASQQDEEQKFFKFISILQQFPMIAFSPTLVREAAYRVGYNNTRTIKEFQKMALVHQQAIQQGQMGNGGNASQQITANATPPQMPMIQKQLASQLTPNA